MKSESGCVLLKTNGARCMLMMSVLLYTPRMFTRGYRVGSAGCGLSNVRMTSALRLPLLRRHVVGFLWCTCNAIPAFHFFVRATVFLHALTVICVFDPSICTCCELLFLCFSVVRLPGFIFCALWIERSLLVLLFLPTFPSCLACSPGRIGPHLQKDSALAWCSSQISHCVISSMIRCSLMSVFPCLLYNSTVRASTSVPIC